MSHAATVGAWSRSMPAGSGAWSPNGLGGAPSRPCCDCNPRGLIACRRLSFVWVARRVCASRGCWCWWWGAGWPSAAALAAARRSFAGRRAIPEQAQGLEGFVNAANALIGPALVAMAAVAPLGCVVGAGALMFGSRRGHGDHRRLAGHADLPRLGQGHRRLSRWRRAARDAIRTRASAGRRRVAPAGAAVCGRVAGGRAGGRIGGAAGGGRDPAGADRSGRSAAGVDALTGGLGGAAVDGFGALLRRCSRGRRARSTATAGVAGGRPRLRGRAHDGGRSGGRAAIWRELAATTSAMAFAALAAVGTVAGVRYWAAGLTGVGRLRGARRRSARIVGAALFIVLWPWLFRHARGPGQRGGARAAGQRQRARRHQPAARAARSRRR